MIEDGLEYITYGSGIRELETPFLLTAPLTVRIQVIDFCIDALYPQYSNNREAAAATVVDTANQMNPKLNDISTYA